MEQDQFWVEEVPEEVQILLMPDASYVADNTKC